MPATIINGAALIDVPRELNSGSRQALKTEALALIAEGQRHLAFDLRFCGYIDASGLGVLVAIAKHAREAGGHVTLIGASDEQRELFDLTRLTPLFQMVSVEDWYRAGAAV